MKPPRYPSRGRRSAACTVASLLTIAAAAPPALAQHTVHEQTTLLPQEGGPLVRVSIESVEVTAPDGHTKASVYGFHYEIPQQSATISRRQRPIIYAFGGGPGISSSLLQFGAFGPLRFHRGSGAALVPQPPFQTEPKRLSLLSAADLVFVDPVGTGWAKSPTGDGANAFRGAVEDAAAVAAFIEAHLKAHDHSRGPVFIMGESYGSIRATLVTQNLLQRAGAANVVGTILIAPALDTSVILGHDLDVVAASALPTMTMSAWYHKRLSNLGTDAPEVASAARAFAREEYLPALFEGSALPPSRRRDIAAKLAELTAIPKGTWLSRDLRLTPQQFAAQLLPGGSEVVGVFDTRFVGSKDTRGDVAAAAILSAFMQGVPGAIESIFPERDTSTYVVFDPSLSADWRRPPGTSSFFSGHLDFVKTLAECMQKSPRLRVFAAAGYYDLCTPFAAAEHMFSRAGIDPARVQLRVYEGGHMMYLDPGSSAKLTGDLSKFIAGSDVD